MHRSPSEGDSQVQTKARLYNSLSCVGVMYVNKVACTFDGCERDPYCKGLCRSHYRQQNKGQDLRPLLETYPEICRESGCDRPVEVKARSLCGRHYSQLRRSGAIGDPQPRSCFNCGITFVPKRNGVARCCSDQCAKTVYRWQRRHGLTPETLVALLNRYGAQCGICQQPLDLASMHIDHDHLCCPSRHSCVNCRRGILCGRCNRGIGMFDDTPERLIEAARYLRDTSLCIT